MIPQGLGFPSWLPAVTAHHRHTLGRQPRAGRWSPQPRSWLKPSASLWAKPSTWRADHRHICCTCSEPRRKKQKQEPVFQSTNLIFYSWFLLTSQGKGWARPSEFGEGRPLFPLEWCWSRDRVGWGKGRADDNHESYHPLLRPAHGQPSACLISCPSLSLGLSPCTHAEMSQRWGEVPKGTRLLFRHSVMSDSWWHHGLQHARLPCLSPTPRACSNPYPLSRWYHPIISSSVIPFSCLQSFPASGSFPMSQFFAPGGQSIGVSASASVLPMNIQDWFPLGFTGLISLQSKGLSRVFSNTTVQKHQFFGTQVSLWSNSHICTWLLEKP